MRHAVLFTAPSILVLAACGADRVPGPGGDQPQISRFALAAEAPPAGVAIDPTSHHLLFLIPSVGILETDFLGQARSLSRYGERGLIDQGYTDLAWLADGSYALAGNGVVFKYRPDTAELGSYFCLEPEMPTEYSENKAITVDAADGRIFAAPARYRYEPGVPPALLKIQHVSYTIRDGVFVSAADVAASGVIAEGIAWVPQTQELLAVQGHQLYTFDLQGRLRSTQSLEGIGHGSGLAYDADSDRLWVTDSDDLEVVGLPGALWRAR